MKLLTALITSAICLVPSVANAFPINEQSVLKTFCSHPGLLAVPEAERRCVGFALEASSRGYSISTIKRSTDELTANAINTDVIYVSAFTDSNIRAFIRRSW